MRRATATVVFAGMKSLTSELLLLFCLVLLVCSAAANTDAQTTNATINGQITDPQGKIVPGVTVQAVNIDTNSVYPGKTNGSGIYVIPALPPGRYRLVVRKDGFKEINKTDLVLHVQDTFEQNFTLEVGSTSESVTVEAGALVMNTTDASVSTVIDRNFVANIPLNGRSFQDLISLTPGVVTQSPQSGGYTGSNGDFSVNGQRTQSNNYIVDGISANTNPGNGNGGPDPGTSGSLGASTVLGTTQSLLSIDALQEFRVESSTYSAEYGLSPGGQFSFVTRSGTNSFHGSLFDYFRNDVFDANDWFNNHYGIAKPALRQNDFGGTIGGPVSIPGVYDGKDKTFFFVSYEGLRLTQPTEATPGEYVPSMSLRAGAAPAVQPILNAFPLPSGPEIPIACDNVTFQCPTGQPLGTIVPSGLAPFLRAYSLPSSINSTLLRLDQQITSRIHLFLRAGYTPSSTETRTLSNLNSSISNQQTYAVGLDTQLSNNSTDQFRIGYSRSLAKNHVALDNFGGAVPINLSLALGNADSPASYSYFFLYFNGVGGTDIGTQFPANDQHQWNITNTLSKSVAHHNLKAGVSYRRITSSFTPGDPDVTPQYESPTSVLTNSADFTQFERMRSPEPVYNETALFGQDEWRVTPSLSLSLGVRWEIDPPPHSENAVKPYPLLGNVNDPSTYSLGTPGGQLFGTTWGNFAPRVGAAWQLRQNPGAQTVVRGGIGIFYDTGAAATYDPLQGLGTQVYTNVAGVALPVNPAQYDLSFAVSPPYQQTVRVVDPHLQLPYTLEWNVSVQQALGEKQNLTVSYLGAEGRRLIKFDTIDVGKLNPEFATGFAVVDQNGLTSNYQALQVQFQRQMSHGVQALASYTWSHSIDFGSEDASFGYARGNSDFDVRDALNAAVTWDLPSNWRNAVSKTLFDGWGLDGRVTARTGFPVTLKGRAFIDPVTGLLQFAGLNLVPNVPLYAYSPLVPGGREINASAFTSAPTNMLGDAPRNFVRGFGETQLNVAIRRTFPIRDNLRLQFRAEAFNVLNHPNFGYVDPNLGDATFGQATSTLANSLGTVSPLYQQGGARSMQFALKLIF